MNPNSKNSTFPYEYTICVEEILVGSKGGNRGPVYDKHSTWKCSIKSTSHSKHYSAFNLEIKITHFYQLKC